MKRATMIIAATAIMSASAAADPLTPRNMNDDEWRFSVSTYVFAPVSTTGSSTGRARLDPGWVGRLAIVLFMLVAAVFGISAVHPRSSLDSIVKIPVQRGFLNLVAIMDLATRDVLSWRPPCRDYAG